MTLIVESLWIVFFFVPGDKFIDSLKAISVGTFIFLSVETETLMIFAFIELLTSSDSNTVYIYNSLRLPKLKLATVFIKDSVCCREHAAGLLSCESSR